MPNDQHNTQVNLNERRSAIDAAMRGLNVTSSDSKQQNSNPRQPAASSEALQNQLPVFDADREQLRRAILPLVGGQNG
jgi:hypothetical protein